MKQADCWTLHGIDDFEEENKVLVVVANSSIEKSANMVNWCNERLGHGSEHWGYFPYGFLNCDWLFYFDTDHISMDHILQFKLTWV